VSLSILRNLTTKTIIVTNHLELIIHLNIYYFDGCILSHNNNQLCLIRSSETNYKYMNIKCPDMSNEDLQTSYLSGSPSSNQNKLPNRYNIIENLRTNKEGLLS
jgi:hypothetical protein